MKHAQTVTLVFLIKKDEILLAMKKRGFGAGKWNGVGGKIEADETLEGAAIRECQEEVGITPIKLEKVAVIDFFLDNFDQHGHVYICSDWEGEPSESEEMKPRWFSVHEIPYKRMWEDDQYWLPAVLSGKKIRASFTFKDDLLVTKSVKTVTTL